MEDTEPEVEDTDPEVEDTDPEVEDTEPEVGTDPEVEYTDREVEVTDPGQILVQLLIMLVRVVNIFCCQKKALTELSKGKMKNKQ